MPDAILSTPRLSSSLQYGWRLLQCFDPENPEWGIVELTPKLGVGSGSTTHRYVSTLVALDFLEQTKAHGKYRRVAGPINRVSSDYEAAIGHGSKVSRSFVKGLWILACFEGEEAEFGIHEVAAKAGLNLSTAHRYVVTWVAIGMLEQNPRTRKYRRAGTVSESPEAFTIHEPNLATTLVRALIILEYYNGSGITEGGLTEFADVCGIAKSSACRYATTLTDLGLLAQDRPHGAYHLGATRLTPDMLHWFDGVSKRSQIVARGFAVLSCLINDDREHSLREISRQVKAPENTIHRYVITFAALGYVVQNPITRWYRMNSEPRALWVEHYKEHLREQTAPWELAAAA